jgi:hypothetical protein
MWLIALPSHLPTPTLHVPASGELALACDLAASSACFLARTCAGSGTLRESGSRRRGGGGRRRGHVGSSETKASVQIEKGLRNAAFSRVVLVVTTMAIAYHRLSTRFFIFDIFEAGYPF